MARGPGGGGLRPEFVAEAGRRERAAMGLVDLWRHGLAKKVVEGNIDGIAAWAEERRSVRPAPR